MILDRPKRRAETIVGVLGISCRSVPYTTREIINRAFDEIGREYDMTISIGTCPVAELPVTITAIVHKEPLRSRWARALDQIRREYGLTLEWEETEIEERGQTIASWVESQRLQSYEKPDFMNQYEKKVRDALLNAPSVFSLPAGVEVKTTGGDDSTTVKYEASADGINWFATAESAAALRSEPDNRVLIKDEVDINPERFKEAAAAGAELREKHAHRFSEASTPTPKSYADTPTGTREWDENIGRNRLEEIGLSENAMITRSFEYAFHMFPTKDENFTDVECPICGVQEVGNSMVLNSMTIGELLSAPSNPDEVVKLQLADTKCGNCKHRLKYDFDNETIEIRRPE